MVSISSISIGNRGVTGKILTIIISLIVAIVALALLWGFVTRSTPFISKMVENTIIGFKKMICEMLILKIFCG